MILDEAIQHCEEVAKEQEHLCKCNDDYNLSQPKWRKCAEEHRLLAEWLKDYKRLKEQEPCDKCEYSTSEGCQYDDITEAIPPFEDCISRQAVLELVADYDLSMGQVVKGIHALPPVTPQPKMGRWINQHIIYTNATVDFKVCSECRYEFSYDAETGVSDANYCPHCGAKMQEVQE